MSWEIDGPLLRNFLIALLAIANPLGKIPVWIEASSDQKNDVRALTAGLLVGTGAAILVVMVFAGTAILGFFGIELAAFRIGGGIVILLIGLSMMRGQVADTTDSSDGDGSVLSKAQARFRDLVVPMVVPLIAGPGSITTVLVYSARTDSVAMRIGMSIAIVLVAALLFGLMLCARPIQKVVGATALAVQTRLFGLLLAALAAQLIVEGLGQVFPAWVESVTIPSQILDEIRESTENDDGSQPK